MKIDTIIESRIREILEKKEIPEERIEAILKMDHAKQKLALHLDYGVSQIKLAKIWGVSRQAINLTLMAQKQYVKDRSQIIEFSNSADERAIEIIANPNYYHLSRQEIADICQITISRVGTLTAQINKKKLDAGEKLIPPRNKGQDYDFELLKEIEDYLAKEPSATSVKVAKAVGVNQSTVYRYMRDFLDLYPPKKKRNGRSKT